MIVRFILCLLAGYAFGCFSTGFVVGKLFHRDIRKEGSGNIGSTNALRTMGVKGGVLTFAGDVLKAVIPLAVLRFGFSDWEPCWQLYGLVLGLGLVLGHNYPFWLKFQGGKGIAATAGIVLMIAEPSVTVGGLLLFVAVVAVSRYVSLGSLFVAWYLPVNTLLFWRNQEGFPLMLLVSCCYTVLAYWRHRSNIQRLLKGTERRLGDKA